MKTDSRLLLPVLTMLLVFAACTADPETPQPESAAAGDCNCTATAEDFRVLDGGEWSGELDYLNYGSDQRSSIPVGLRVDRIEGSSVTYSIRYPGEEQYNATERLTISDDGTSIDGRIIVDRQQEAGGGLVLTTEGKGEDDNRPADIQTVYFVSPNEFRVRKNVRFEGDAEFFNRNEYRYRRD